jgi:hypothetical protein
MPQSPLGGCYLTAKLEQERFGFADPCPTGETADFFGDGWSVAEDDLRVRLGK